MGALSKIQPRGSSISAVIQLALVVLVVKVFATVVKGRSVRKSKSDELRLNKKFFRRLWYLIKICIPGVLTKEAFGTAVMVYLLLVRTRLTLKFANIIGKSGKFLIQGKRELFISCLLDLGLLAIPGSIIHAGIQYSKLLVQQMFRDNIQSSLHEKYLQGGNVYLIATQNSLDNPDYRMTSDTKKFCSEFTDFFRSVLKPSIDVATFSIALAQEGSYGAPGFLFVYYMLVAALMSAILPNFSYLVAKSQEKEGNLRTNHNQLVRHAEEVAFYNGESLEFEHSEKLLRNIVRHEEFIKKVKWCGGLMEALFIKHGSTAIGYLVCGGAVARMKNVLSPADLSELYFRSTQLFIPLSNAIGKLLLLRKKVGALCSSTHRIGEVFEFLDKLNSMDKSRDLLHYKENNLNEIIIEGVDIVTPQNVVLVKNFNVRITKNKHVLIMGSNGSGKSAIIRALTKLWPVKSGQISLPQEKNVFYTPQRTYLPPGTLRSLMVYPMTETEAAEKVTDEELHRYAEVMGVAHVIDREGGLDANHNWQEVLSGGERQRIALTRILANKAVFAVLDECTSAVSQDDEPRLYGELQKAGVTLVSISHRDLLKTMHDVLVELNGEGGYTISELRKA